MLRICLCLLIGLASAGVAAREVRLSPNDACPTSSSSQKSQELREQARGTTQARGSDGKAPSKPSVHSDVGATGGRMQSPRWHSFLPGMFR